MHQALPAFAAYAGPESPKILLVGEAWGESEAQARQPFVGYSGRELWLMLGEAMSGIAPELHGEAVSMFKYDNAWIRHRSEWLAAAGIGMTNVLAFRPPSNNIEHISSKRTEVGSAAGALPAIQRGRYLRDEFLPELTRLEEEILQLSPNLIVAMGNTACWALLHATNIGSIRGAVAESRPFGPSGRKFKVLPTYHPAGVMRQWSWRPIVVADLIKASREAEYPEIRRPARRVLVNPTLDEVLEWEERWLRRPPALLAADIETGQGMIKCISFAASVAEAIVIPFVDLDNPTGSYWPTDEIELRAWSAVKTMLTLDCPKVGQNFIYDLQYLTSMGIFPTRCVEDTMLLHHSFFPEMQKGLGFLGSIYTNEASWKLMRRPKADTVKKDE